VIFAGFSGFFGCRRNFWDGGDGLIYFI
jgi:hypothetical protein